MTLDLDIRTAEIVSEAIADRMELDEINLRQAIEIYSAKKIDETVNYAKSNSRFYAEKLAGDIGCWEDIPFTSQDDLREREMDFLCVNPSQISRIVTLNTSGTTGKPKRIFFTKEDQQLTVDFFNHGMRLIIDKNDKVLILMPSSSDGSIGRLLGKGISDLGAKSIEYGVPFKKSVHGEINSDEAKEILQLMSDERVTCIVATPTHMVSLARTLKKEIDKGGKPIYPRSILVSAEYVPDKTVMMLEETFQSMIFEHYGMTEMGLGCAVSCGYGRGYHVREADLFIELINPLTGKVVKGESPRTPGFSNYGEIVFTTLTRKGMPFIRYRTGDFSRWILQDCPCGSQLKRLDKVVPGEEHTQG